MPRREPIRLPSADYLREALNYNPETGELRWKHRPREHFDRSKTWGMWNTQHAGTPAGSVYAGRSPRKMIHISGISYWVHRVIWKWMTGEEPPATLDHKDRNGLNNRWNNLRPATYRQQNQNRQRLKNAAIYPGVYPTGRKWRARITVNRVTHNLGSFPTTEEAAAAYDAAARKHYGEFYFRY